MARFVIFGLFELLPSAYMDDYDSNASTVCEKLKALTKATVLQCASALTDLRDRSSVSNLSMSLAIALCFSSISHSCACQV